jgi:hypothetical protein
LGELATQHFLTYSNSANFRVLSVKSRVWSSLQFFSKSSKSFKIFEMSPIKAPKRKTNKKQECPICKIMVHNVHRHVKTHESNRKIRCDQCNRSILEANLENHRNLHLLGVDPALKTSCKLCHANIRKDSMKKHLETHKKSVPENFSRCLYCNRLVGSLNLNNHIQVLHPFVANQIGQIEQNQAEASKVNESSVVHVNRPDQPRRILNFDDDLIFNDDSVERVEGVIVAQAGQEDSVLAVNFESGDKVAVDKRQLREVEEVAVDPVDAVQLPATLGAAPLLAAAVAHLDGEEGDGDQNVPTNFAMLLHNMQKALAAFTKAKSGENPALP